MQEVNQVIKETEGLLYISGQSFRFLTVAAILLFVIGNETIAALFLMISFIVIFMFKFDYQLSKWPDMMESISQEVENGN